MRAEGIGDTPVAAGDYHRETGRRGGQQRFLVWQADDQRLTAKDVLGHRCDPVHDGRMLARMADALVTNLAQVDGIA